MTRKLKIFVIVVTYNGKKWIKKCLDSINNSTYPLSAVIVDNNSEDDTIEYIESNFLDIEIIKTGANQGFGKANNIGIKYALTKGADYVYLLNQDAYLFPDCIQNMLNVPDIKSYGILSPVHLNGDGTKLDVHFKHYVSSIAIPEYLEDLVLKREKPVYEGKYVNAAGWLLPIATLNKVGGFDPFFYHYGEDLHYCQRVNYHGFKIGICTQAFMNHDRENAGNVALYKKNIERRSLMEYYLNINLSKKQINTALRNRHVKNCFLFIKSLITLNFSETKNLLDAYRFILTHKKQINKNRKANKRQGKLWF
ncbi:glycosyltransferase family 2 protein [Saccharicrinis sp. FJH54]|uniref:glycosyltransferase family 2 protein n=1 Tax=Saccharicrinis sp. FJH54 TaxID=3344665 RepID=UPI0035D3F4E5